MEAVVHNRLHLYRTLLFGKQMLDYGKTISASQRVCIQTYLDQEDKCSGEGERACRDKVLDNEGQCMQIYSPTKHGRLEEYALEAVASLVIGYLVLLTIRTIGWIAAGFGRTDPDRTSA